MHLTLRIAAISTLAIAAPLLAQDEDDMREPVNVTDNTSATETDEPETQTQLGDGAEATTNRTTAIGSNAKATNLGATALGGNSNASGEASVAVGQVTASAEETVAIGQASIASQPSAIAIG